MFQHLIKYIFWKITLLVAFSHTSDYFNCGKKYLHQETETSLDIIYIVVCRFLKNLIVLSNHSNLIVSTPTIVYSSYHRLNNMVLVGPCNLY